MAPPNDESRPAGRVAAASRAKRPSPRCPATGQQGCRLVQWVSSEFLTDLWRIVFKVDVRPSFRGVERFGLWRSPTGLYFFDPPRAGDAGFYAALYERPALARFKDLGPKAEHLLAAAHVRSGETVLDVGAGDGAFRAALPHADYVGLEPYAPRRERPDWLRAETLDSHLAGGAGGYDVVSAFQVLEHVEDPFALVRDMARATRPGGRVMIGVPHAPSASTRIPNYLINATPHHISWWTEAALRAIAERAGLEPLGVEIASWTRIDALIYWIARCTPLKMRDRYYRHAWTWHAAAAVGAAAGWAMWRLRGAPDDAADEGASLLLVARRPV